LKISSPSKTLTASRNSAIYCMAEKLALCVIADATNSAVSGWSLACVRCTGASQDLAPLTAGSFSSYCSLRTTVDGCRPCVEIHAGQYIEAARTVPAKSNLDPTSSASAQQPFNIRG
jgi:hypothetical protein